MFENNFGMPDALPASYGYADAQPATVRMNAATSRAVPNAARQPVVHNPHALGNAAAPNQAGVLRYSQLEPDDDDDGYGAAKKGGKKPAKKKVDLKAALEKTGSVLESAGKLTRAVSDAASGKSSFQDSGLATEAAPPTSGTPTENVGSVPSFWQKKYVGVPTWGWATIAGVAALGGGFLWYRSSQKAKAAASAPATPPKAEKKAPPPAETAPALPAPTEGGE